MIQSRVTITDTLAVEIGKIASEHPDTAISIAWDDDFDDESLWLVKVSKPYGSHVYLVNDETGERQPAGLGVGASL